MRVWPARLLDNLKIGLAELIHKHLLLTKFQEILEGSCTLEYVATTNSLLAGQLLLDEDGHTHSHAQTEARQRLYSRAHCLLVGPKHGC